MKLGLYLRNMGPQSSAALLLECARTAEAAGVDDLWVADHVAIPPDNAEGSGGRYLDPLATLAYLAGATTRIGLATGVLVLPYRPPLATAKWIATIQELSGGRLLLASDGVLELTPKRSHRERRGQLAEQLAQSHSMDQLVSALALGEGTQLRDDIALLLLNREEGPCP